MSPENYIAVGAAFCLLLTGCGGGSPGSEETILTGIFVDSPVEGITFATDTQSGTTTASGDFTYLAGELVTFSIGATQLPAVAAKAQVTPIDIAATSSTPTAMTTNIARLLQSLDLDGDPGNGITIPSAVAISAPPMNFDVSTAEFASNAAVINMVANSGSVTTELISAEVADAHLSATLAPAGNDQASGNSDIVLDLRDSVWIVEHAGGQCEAANHRDIFRFSQTRFSGESSSAVYAADGSCSREPWTWDNAMSDINRSGFMFLCGGDGQCTMDEINRTITLAADDPRNGCVDANGANIPMTRQISHVPGSDLFEYGHCSTEYRGQYIRQ